MQVHGGMDMTELGLEMAYRDSELPRYTKEPMILMACFQLPN